MNSKNILYCIWAPPLLMGLQTVFFRELMIVLLVLGIIIGLKHLRGILRHDWKPGERIGLKEIYMAWLLIFFLLSLSPLFSEMMYAFAYLIPAGVFFLLLIILRKNRPVSFFHFIIPSFIILLSISILILKIFEFNMEGNEIKGKNDTVLRNTLGGCGDPKSFPFNVI